MKGHSHCWNSVNTLLTIKVDILFKQTCIHLSQKTSRFMEYFEDPLVEVLFFGFIYLSVSGKVLTEINLQWECKEIIFSAEGAIKVVFYLYIRDDCI